MKRRLHKFNLALVALLAFAQSALPFAAGAEASMRCAGPMGTTRTCASMSLSMLSVDGMLQGRCSCCRPMAQGECGLPKHLSRTGALGSGSCTVVVRNIASSSRAILTRVRVTAADSSALMPIAKIADSSVSVFLNVHRRVDRLALPSGVDPSAHGLRAPPIS